MYNVHKLFMPLCTYIPERETLTVIISSSSKENAVAYNEF